MILFADDWGMYPTADIDLTTRNKSWVQLAYKYQMMGVKNNNFMLALVNQDLKGIDPFDEQISDREILLIAEECFINPWFFFRECAKVPAQAGVGANYLEANRGNIGLWWSFFNHITTILIQIRQTGKSLSTDILMTYLLNILCQNTKINLLTKDDNLRRRNIERLKEIAAELPFFLHKGTKADANNGEEITIKALGNLYSTHVPQSSEKRANNLGRGLTTPVIHIDEPPFQTHIRTAYPAMITAMNAVVDEAKAKGEPYGIILTTTAGKKDDKDGAYVYRMVQDAMPWTEKLFDCKNEEDLRRTVTTGSRSKSYMVNITLNHKQLGKDDEWLKSKIIEARGDEEAINRDYFNIWTSGTQKSPFTPEVAERIANGRTEVVHDYIADNYGYSLRFYIPEREIHQRLMTGQFILGMDPSDAGGGDDISFYLTDVASLDTIAVGTFNETNLFNLSSWICDFLVQYKNVTAIIERRSSGASILDHLLWFLPQKGEDPFKRLFNRIVNDHLENPERYKEILVPMGRRPENIYTRYKTAFGWATSGSGMTSRSGLYSTTLRNGIRLCGSRLKDIPLIDQVLGLEIKNGRVDHQDGNHDDLVIGWLLSIWFLTQGTNLGHYGIDSKLVLSRAKEKEIHDPIEYRRQVEQAEIRSGIEQLLEEFSKEKDELIANKIEQKIRLLERNLLVDGEELNTVDEMIRKAKEKKKENIRQKRYQNNFYEDQYRNMGYSYHNSFSGYRY